MMICLFNIKGKKVQIEQTLTKIDNKPIKTIKWSHQVKNTKIHKHVHCIHYYWDHFTNTWWRKISKFRSFHKDICKQTPQTKAYNIESTWSVINERTGPNRNLVKVEIHSRQNPCNVHVRKPKNIINLTQPHADWIGLEQLTTVSRGSLLFCSSTCTNLHVTDSFSPHDISYHNGCFFPLFTFQLFIDIFSHVNICLPASGLVNSRKNSYYKYPL